MNLLTFDFNFSNIKLYSREIQTLNFSQLLDSVFEKEITNTNQACVYCGSYHLKEINRFHFAKLLHCKDCGFVFSKNIPTKKELDECYSAVYAEDNYYSPITEKRYNEIIDSFEPYRKTNCLLDYGCGDGLFLDIAKKRGWDVYGIEYSETHINNCKAKGLKVYNSDDFQNILPPGSFDVVTSFEVIEHIPDPVAFLRMVRHNIGDRRDTGVFFEVPNVLFTIRDLGIWDIIYEHCSYFSSGSLVRCFIRAGFTVTSVAEEYGTQFLCVEAIPNGPAGAGVEGDPGGEELVFREARAFAARCRQKLESWSTQLDGLQQAGQRVVVWGAGSKGVTFLNRMSRSDLVECVVDINPRKQGMYVAGTGHPIVAPDFLREDIRSTILVMNPIYADEIRKMIASMDVSADILVA